MMITRLNFEFSDAPWAATPKPRESVKRVFSQIAGKPKGDIAPTQAVEHMSLSELFYMIMMSEEAAV